MLEKLYEQFPIMEKLKEERVFLVQEYGDGNIEIRESCDDYFNIDIEKEEAKEISDFFLALSEQMQPSKINFKPF